MLRSLFWMRRDITLHGIYTHVVRDAAVARRHALRRRDTRGAPSWLGRFVPREVFLFWPRFGFGHAEQPGWRDECVTRAFALASRNHQVQYPLVGAVEVEAPPRRNITNKEYCLGRGKVRNILQKLKVVLRQKSS